MRLGKTSVAQVVTLLVVAGGIYTVVIFFPVVTQRMTIGRIAQRAAAKMWVERDDPAIREMIDQEIRSASIVGVGGSDVTLRRLPDTVGMTVEIRVVQRVNHLGGKTQTLKKVVVKTAAPFDLKILKESSSP